MRPVPGSPMTLATSRIMYFDLSCSAVRAFAIFCFFSMVSLTVIVTDFSITPLFLGMVSDMIFQGEDKIPGQQTVLMFQAQ